MCKIAVLAIPYPEHVYRRACESSARSVVVATDSGEIRDAVAAFGGSAVMTS
ncbi:cytidylyltransferase domain-containing protein, partial [Pseudomonadota bacterium]